MRILSLSLVLVLGFLLSACTSLPSPEGKPLPQLDYQNRESVYLKVSSIAFTDETQGAAQDYVPYVQPIDVAVRDYLQGRFEAVGGFEELEFILEDVQIAQSFEESDNSVGAFLNVAGQDVYKITITVNVALTDGHGNLRGKRLTLGRRIFVSEHASVAARDKAQLEGLEGLIQMLDEALLESFENEFSILRLTRPEFG